MKAYLSNLLPRLNQYSKSLDQKEILVDQPWVLLDEQSNKQQYIFERDGNLIMSLNGKVQYGKWRYIPAAKSLVIDRGENDSLLLNQTFVSDGACILKLDGPLNEPWILVNQRIVPDLNLEGYLNSLLPSSSHSGYIKYDMRKELDLENMKLFYTDKNHTNGPVIGTEFTTIGDEKVNGTFKGLFTDYYYCIENNILKDVFIHQQLLIENGSISVKRKKQDAIKTGDPVFINESPAPDGIYKILDNPDIIKLKVQNGYIIEVIDYNWVVGLIFYLFIITIIILAFVYS